MPDFTCMRVHVREDVVCYPDVMPFRSMGGSGVSPRLAAEIAYTVTWDPDGDDLSTYNAQHATQNAHNIASQTSPATGSDHRASIRPPSAAPSLHLTTAANTPNTPQPEHGGASDSHSPGSTTPEGYSPFRFGSPIPRPQLTPNASQTPKTPKAAYNEAHGTVSTRNARGEWKSGHCSRAECTLGYNHPGPCSDIIAPILPDVNPAFATRGARKRANTTIAPIAEEETETEVEQEANEETGDDDRAIDALLATSYSVDSIQMLGTTAETGLNAETVYGTCIDALSATVDLNELHAPIGKNLTTTLH